MNNHCWADTAYRWAVRMLVLLSVLPSLTGNPARAQAPNAMSGPIESGIRRSEARSRTGAVKLAIAWGDRLKPPVRYSGAMANLRDAMARWTRIPVGLGGPFRIGSPEIMKMPIVIISAETEFEFTETEKSNLRAYVEQGGLLVVDDAGADIPNSLSGAALLQMAREVAGDRWFGPVPSDHSIFRTPFDLGGPPRGNEATPLEISAIRVSAGRPDIQVESRAPENLLGAFIDGRLAILYSPRGYYAAWNDPASTPQLKFGVNLILYALAAEE